MTSLRRVLTEVLSGRRLAAEQGDDLRIEGYQPVLGAPDQACDVGGAGAYARSLCARAKRGRASEILCIATIPREPIGFGTNVQERRHGPAVKRGISRLCCTGPGKRRP